MSDLSEQYPAPLLHTGERFSKQSEFLVTAISPSPSKDVRDAEILELSIVSALKPTVSNETKNSTSARTAAHRKAERVHLLTLCWSMVLAGWNDASTGPLLPRIQGQYQIGFTVVSILFIAACCGFVTGAAALVKLSHRYGVGKTLVIGAAFPCLGYIIQSTAPPFPVLCLGYLLDGIGLALVNAQATGYVAEFQEDSATKMGFLHAFYGLGALLSPIVATQFAQQRHWSFHFVTSLGIAVINLVALLWVFRGRHQSDLLASIGQSTRDSDTGKISNFSSIARSKNVHLLALFSLIYVGVEVTTGGWIVTFIIEKRGGGPSSGYISTGFFLGLTLGRVALLWINEKVGEYKVIYIYSALCMALEITIWLVPSLIQNAVAVSLTGVLLGPMYPILMNHSARILPRWLLTGSIGWIAGVGQTGSALTPFATGALAGKFGIGSLQPFMVANICAMAAFWAIVPSKHVRVD